MVLPSCVECLFPHQIIIIMNIIIWNCRGALKPSFQTHVRELVHNHNPAILVLMETKVGGERAREISGRLPFDNAIHTDTVGYAGGLWMLWNSDRVEVTSLANTEQEIHTIVKVMNSNSCWLFTAVYASPRSAERHILWDNLNKVAELHNMPWVLAGDFNEPLLDDDKFGGRAVSINRSLHFKDCLDNFNMMDIGFSGPHFTWTNKREVQALIQERIDRFFVNPSWCLLFPEAKVVHLTRCHSDHCPVLLELTPASRGARKRLFKFQTCWLTDLTFPKVVSQAWEQTHSLAEAIEKFTKDAGLWNKVHFGNIFAKKKNIKARLNGIQRLCQLSRHLFFLISSKIY